ncbi:hypothetical protein [Methylobacterium iners]|uniref:hypothetical protein n=1 Tax=Methylobacterium iners TaxID=418707 RepID=UPI001EE2EBCF|nr:hypothetical protein [Methylobacterium iners]
MNFDEELTDVFSADQRARLKAALNLTSEIEVDSASIAIAGLLLGYFLKLAAKNRIPTRVKSKQKLLQIAAAARKLNILLSDFTLTRNVTAGLEEADLLPPELAKIFYRRPLWGTDDLNVHDMPGLLQNIDTNATRLATNDRSFSFHYMLPTMQEANRDFDATVLWPRLFKFWELAGNKVASTPDGPTFRFLTLIHEVAQIKGPNPDSLRSACERWRTDPMRKRKEDVPWAA